MFKNSRPLDNVCQFLHCKSDSTTKIKNVALILLVTLGTCSEARADCKDLLYRQGGMPPRWGGDEFVDSQGFTQSGAPYQIFSSDTVQDIKRKLQKRVIERLKNPQKFDEDETAKLEQRSVNGNDGVYFQLPVQFVPFEPKRN